uniref:Uncharacterized protein n=1 Tax=Rhizophora mucronata TaxID=61149 RepID=A0A2P2NCH6_RHIMU
MSHIRVQFGRRKKLENPHWKGKVANRREFAIISICLRSCFSARDSGR